MHTLHNSEKHFLFHKPWNFEIIEYYIYKILFIISNSLASIFIPIYLYAEVGYSIAQILLFFIINQMYFQLCVPFAPKLIEKIGVKHTLSMHLPFLAAYLYGLRFLSGDFISDLWIIFLILFLRAVPRSSMETAEIVFISKNVLEKKHYGRSLSKIRVALIFASLISPLIGGIVIFLFGYDNLFNVAIALLAASAIPLLLTKDKHFKAKFTPSSMYSFLLHKVPRNVKLAETGRIFPESLMWVIWPLFLYIAIKDIVNIGILITISAVLAMLISRNIGERIDKKSPKKVLKTSVRASTSLFFIRTVFANPLLIGISDMINRILEPVLMISYEKYLYSFLGKGNTLERANAKSYLTETIWTISFAFLFIYFLAIGRLGVQEDNLAIFILLFVLYGATMLLMENISKK